jgi:hypothetical protein
MNTRDLINALVKDVAVRRLRPIPAVVLSAIFGSIAAALVFAVAFDLRTDIEQAAATLLFLVKLLFVLTLAVSAIGALLRLVRPDGSVGGWSWGFAAATGLLMLAVIGEISSMQASTLAAGIMGVHPLACLGSIVSLSVPPLAGLLIGLRRGAPTNPRLAGAMAGLAAGAAAATIYVAHCPDDSPLFVAAWYMAALSFVTLAGCLFGDRLLRW